MSAKFKDSVDAMFKTLIEDMLESSQNTTADSGDHSVQVTSTSRLIVPEESVNNSCCCVIH